MLLRMDRARLERENPNLLRPKLRPDGDRKRD